MVLLERTSLQLPVERTFLNQSAGRMLSLIRDYPGHLDSMYGVRQGGIMVDIKPLPEYLLVTAV